MSCQHLRLHAQPDRTYDQTLGGSTFLFRFKRPFWRRPVPSGERDMSEPGGMAHFTTQTTGSFLVVGSPVQWWLSSTLPTVLTMVRHHSPESAVPLLALVTYPSSFLDSIPPSALIIVTALPSISTVAVTLGWGSVSDLSRLVGQGCLVIRLGASGALTLGASGALSHQPCKSCMVLIALCVFNHSI